MKKLMTEMEAHLRCMPHSGLYAKSEKAPNSASRRPPSLAALASRRMKCKPLAYFQHALSKATRRKA